MAKVYTGLSASNLRDRPTRAQTMLDKIEKNEDFYLTDGSTVKIDADNSVEFVLSLHELLRTGNQRRLSAASFRTTRGVPLKVTALGKSGEFGGKGAGGGTVAEDRALSDIRGKLMAILEKEKKPFIKVKVGKEIVEAADIISTPGTPKSDFHFVDASGQEVAWISHKDGTTAKAYQQYGGLTELDKLFPAHSEIKKFIEDTKALTNGKFETGQSFMRPLKDDRIKKGAVYGIDYTKANGRQHVNMLCQGIMNLQTSGQYHILKSSHDMSSGTLPTADYRCMLFVRKGDRSNFGVGSARYMVAPYALRRGTTKDI